MKVPGGGGQIIALPIELYYIEHDPTIADEQFYISPRLATRS
jgi:hypothetical protein